MLLRARAAVPHHRHGLRARRLPRPAPAPSCSPYRFEAGRRPRRLRRAPPRLHGRPLHRLHGAGRPPGRHPRPLLLLPDHLLRRRPAAARPGREVPGRLSAPYLRNGYGLTECTAPCASVPPGQEAPVDPASGTLAVGVPGPDTVVRIVDDAGRGGALRRAGRDRRPRPAGRARLLAAARGHRRDLPGRRTAHRRHRVHGRGRLAVRRRPQEGHDQRVRLQGVAARGRGRAVHPPGGARGGRRRRSPTPTAARRVKAYVSLRPGAERGRRRARPRTARSGWPRTSTRAQVEILPELPKTTSGKILRRELRSRRRTVSSSESAMHRGRQVAAVAQDDGRRRTARSRSGCWPPPPGSSPSAATTAPRCRRSSRRPASPRARSTTTSAPRTTCCTRCTRACCALQQERLDAFAGRRRADREAAAGRGGRRRGHHDREPRRRDDLLPLDAPPEPGEEQAGARRAPPLPRALPRAGRGGPAGRGLLHGDPGRPGGRLPLRLRPPPVAPGTARTARSARSRSPTTSPTCCCARCAPDDRYTRS